MRDGREREPGRGQADASSAAPAAAAARAGAPARPERARRAADEQREQATSTAAEAANERQLRAPEVRGRARAPRALKYDLALDRAGRDDAVAGPQQQDRGLGHRDGGHEPRARGAVVCRSTRPPHYFFMHVAIVSDIHGNRHAFEAVLDDVRNAERDAIWCLGDLVGYGADPNDCVRARARAAPTCAWPATTTSP